MIRKKPNLRVADKFIWNEFEQRSVKEHGRTFMDNVEVQQRRP